MDMARSTVVQRVNHLMTDGLVVTGPTDLGESSGSRGRPAIILHFNASAGVVLVAQLGITGARVAAADLDGALLAESFEPFPIESGPDAVVDYLEASLSAVLNASGHERADVRGLGIGMPSSVELATTRGPETVLSRSWEDFPIRDRLQDAFGVPAFVDNDVNLLALGEQRSAWPTTTELLCVKAGSVIGCGMVVNGEVVRGEQGLAGNIGHMAVPGDTTPCVCGNAGCLDAVAGGRALVGRLRAAGVPVRDVAELASLARDGVPEAARAVRLAGRSIGEVLAYAVNLLNPGVIAVWGYLAEAEAELLAGIRETVYQRSLPAMTQSLQLVKAQLGDEAGLVGAAVMVVSQILSPETLDEYLTIRAAGRPGRVDAPDGELHPTAGRPA
jgi:predicted NBD/HSP70 family sugar kinase